MSPSDAPGVGPPGAAGARAPGAGAAGDRRRCASCRELYPPDALDERLWCTPCREALERKLRWGSHGAALLITVPFGIWVLLVSSSEVLSPFAWVLPLGASYYLGWRIGRELVKGWVRLTSRRDG